MGGFVKKTADVDFFFQPLLKLTFERFRRVQIGQPLVDSVHGFAAQLYMLLDILLCPCCPGIAEEHKGH